MFCVVFHTPHFMQTQDVETCDSLMAFNGERAIVMLQDKVLADRPGAVSDEVMRRLDRVVREQVVNQVVQRGLEMRAKAKVISYRTLKAIK